MSDIPDFDFDFLDPQMDPQQGTFDDMLADVNFNGDVDSGFGDGFEDRSPDLTNVDWQKDLDRIMDRDLETILAQDPIFNSQSYQTQMYPDYIPMGSQMNVQPTIYQQPVVTQINGQQMWHHQPIGPDYTWPATSTDASANPAANATTWTSTTINAATAATRNDATTTKATTKATGNATTNATTKTPGNATTSQSTSATNTLTTSPPKTQCPQELTSHRELPSAGTQTTSPPLKRPAKNHNGEALLNDRIPRKTHQNKGPGTVEPERYYGPSPPKPRDWGPRNERGKYLFTYTEKGELAAGLFLTAREMRLYLLGPSQLDDAANFAGPYRLPGVKLRTKKKRQGLTLWVGWPAAMSNARYPRGGESTKCRFKNCPYGQRTIALGDPWVIFDERQNADGEVIDPFHNAGYVHLFCLESNFDLVDLWQCLDVRPDYRVFKRESHPYFCLAYKLPGVDTIVKEWWFTAFRDWEVARSHGLKRMRVHESSLAQRLVTHKLENEPKAQMANRRKRGGADISKHRGDPEVKSRLVAFRRNGLLDERGWPVPGADQLLDEIENAKRQKKRGNISDPIIIPDMLPSPLPVHGYGQLPHYPAHHVNVKDPAHATQPVYSTPPFHPTPDLVHLNQPMPVPIYTRSPHRAGRDGAKAKLGRGEPGKADGPPHRVQPNARRSAPDIKSRAAFAQALTSDLHGVDEDLGVDDLDALFDDPVTEMALDDDMLTDVIDGHITGSEKAQAEPARAGPAPTPPHEVRANQSDSNGDSLDDLFGKPGSSPSGSPKAGGSPSPAKAESPWVTTRIKIESLSNTLSMKPMAYSIRK
ncbi:hypothetical protein CIB48_g5557 [Xylaria polymorpha]|nr:hypothetical protein CIB48_g5557 [Xylaria polymorpha]